MAQSLAGTEQSEKDRFCAAVQQETLGNILCANLAGLRSSHVLVFENQRPAVTISVWGRSKKAFIMEVMFPSSLINMTYF